MKSESLTRGALALALCCALALCRAPAGAARAAAGAPARAPRASTPGGVRPNAYETREGRLRIFDEVWEQVRERYFDPGFQGVDWQQVRQQLRPRAAEAHDEAE